MPNNDKIISYVDMKDVVSGTEGTSKGLVVSIMTTGLSPSDEMFVVNALPFTFSDDLEICSIGTSFISAKEVELSPTQEKHLNVRTESLRGKKFDIKKFLFHLEDVELVICHNASFVYSFLAKEFPKSALKEIPFACTMRGINYQNKGFSGVSLELLTYKYGFWYKSLDEPKAILKLLSLDGNFQELIEKVFLPSYTLYLENTSFDQKEKVKQLGFQWNPTRKAWFKADVMDVDKEVATLKDNDIHFNEVIEPNDPSKKYKAD